MPIRVDVLLVLLMCAASWPAAAVGTLEAATPRHAVAMAAVPPADAGFVLTAWSARDGLPAASGFPATDSEGLLLLASQRRFYRFDGVRFSPVENAGGAPLRVDAVGHSAGGENGDLWIGTRNGEIVRIARDAVTRFDATDGLPANTEIRVVAGDDGQVLAGTARGLYRLHDGRWHKVALAGDQAIWALRFDGRRWWAIAGSTLVRIGRDLSSMEAVALLDEDINGGLIGNARTGIWLWQSSGDRNLCRLGQQLACFQVGEIYFPAIDEQGVVWWNKGSKVFGLDLRLADAPDPAGQGVPLRSIETGLELNEIEAGRDGSLWLIAGGRLLRLARTGVERVPSPSGAVVTGPEGKVWVASFIDGVYQLGRPPPSAALFRNDEGSIRVGAWADPAVPARRLSAGEVAAESRPVIVRSFDDAPGTVVNVASIGGRLFAATLTPAALWTFADDRWRRHSALPMGKGAVVRAIARDSKGTVYVGATRDPHGLHAFDGHRWHPVPWRGAGVADEVLALHVDRRDRVWIGHRSGAVTMLDGRTTRRYAHADGLAVGPVRAFVATADGLWVVGMDGVGRFRGDAYEPLALDERSPVSGITGLAFDDAGAMWLGAAQGIARISQAQWSAAVGHADVRARLTLLGELQGVSHPIVDTAPLPTVARAADGSLWFYTLGTVYRIDPRNAPASRRAPSLAITAVTADGVRQDPGSALRIPAGTRRVTVAFRALAPVVQDRTAFRYRISGLEDGGWSDVKGSEVVLDRLPPGDYAFELQASGEDGEWNAAPATFAMSMAPTFWQSPWSKVLLAIALCAITALAFVVRGRQREMRRHAIAQAQLREREKIARDLHDTLLQGVNGLLMTMQAEVGRIGPDPATRERLEQSMDIAERVLVEGRDRVSSLRSLERDGPELAQALQMHARDLARERRVMCQVQATGEPRTLDAAIEDEMVQIGREALTNAFHHACATEITLDIHYRIDEVRVEVRDDGIGLRPSGLDERKHWGIQGMHERATAIGGRLELANRPEGGASVVLAVPARAAYRRAPDRGARRLLRYLRAALS